MSADCGLICYKHLLEASQNHVDLNLYDRIHKRIVWLDMQ